MPCCDLERGGYLPKEVAIKLDGRHTNAYTHVPLAMSVDGGRPAPQYLDTMIEGATEHGLTGTLDELRAVRLQDDG